MYVPHGVRHVDFRGLTGSQRTPRVLGRHRKYGAKITLFRSPNRLPVEEHVKNMRKMGETGEEKGLCKF